MAWWRFWADPPATQDGSNGAAQSSAELAALSATTLTNRHPAEQRDTTMKPDVSPRKENDTIDSDVEAFLAELAADDLSDPTARQASSPKASSTKQSSTPQPSSALAESLLPTTMSCRQAFDQAFYCQSVGGQFNNVYRYGGLRDCAENWSAWMFCMRTRSQPEKQRRELIREHYRQRAEKYRTGPSSEDVWEARTELVQAAFHKDPDAL
ncbi:hypothetical protein BDY21DRAFT_335916, partial [Lineolata rhizophorae]